MLTDLWDVIAAKGMEEDTFFEAAARDIRWLPRLEGTVHVNTALMVKFMPNYLFAPDESMPAIGVADEPVNDDFLFDQGPTRGLGHITFRDYRPVLDGFAAIPNVAVFQKQVDAFVALVAGAPPSKEQQDDVDFTLAIGQLFSLLVYAGLVLEAVPAWACGRRAAGRDLRRVRPRHQRLRHRPARQGLHHDGAGRPRPQDSAPAGPRPGAVRPSLEKHVLVHKDAYQMSP